MNARFRKIALDLLNLPTAPFAEQAVVEYVSRFVARRPGLEMAADRWGNLLIRHTQHASVPAGARLRRPLVFCAHMDHPGFVALEMPAPGTLAARWIGGVPDPLFPKARVRFHSAGKWVKGVVQSATPRQKFFDPKVVTIAVREDVAPGSVGMWDFPDAKVVGTRLIARGCDDVAGTASLLCLLDEALRRNVRREFYVFLTRAEEGGFFGAIGAGKARTLPANAVIVAVETSKALPNARQGDGPIIRVGDRDAVFTPAVSAFLAAVARDEQRRDPTFRFQRKLMDGGTCESAVYVTYGYEAGGLCLALGNYHNVTPNGRRLAAEHVDTRDFEGLVRLYLAAVAGLDRYGKAGDEFRAKVETRFRAAKHLF